MNNGSLDEKNFGWQFFIFRWSLFILAYSAYNFFTADDSSNNFLSLIAWGICGGAFVWISLKNFYKESVKFALLFLLAFCVFPAIQWKMFLTNPDNYSFEQSLLSRNLARETKILAKYSDSLHIRRCLQTLPDSILNAKPKTDQNLSFFTLVIKPIQYSQPRPHQFRDSTLSFIASSGKVRYQFLYNESKTLRQYFFEFETSLLNTNRKVFENPKYVYIHDFWFESITGFLFGEIKTDSVLSRFLRFFHIIATYLFLFMTNKLMDASGFFEWRRKKIL